MVYFVSGHRDITISEFDEYYASYLHKLLVTMKDKEEELTFVVGDCAGADKMTIDYLINAHSKGYKFRLMVYHMFLSPRTKVPSWVLTVGQFKTDVARDTAMTAISNIDLAWIRKGKEKSGTAQNILRRWTMS